MSPLTDFEVPLNQLRWSCKSIEGDICGTADAEAISEIIGQDRAIDAIKLGLRIEQPGYNVFIVGYSGTGRTTTIKHMLQSLGLEDGAKPEDLCYVNNFSNPDTPRALLFPAGVGAQFRDEMQNMIQRLRGSIPDLLESDELRARRKEIIETFEEKQKELLRNFEKDVKAKDFAMTQVQMGGITRPDVSPVIGGQPVPIAELEAKTEAGEFPQERYDQIKKTHDEFTEEMIQIFKKTRENQKQLSKELEKLHVDAVGPIVYESIESIKSEFKADKLEEYLTEVSDSIMKNLARFQQRPDDQNQSPLPVETPEQNTFTEYSVNLVVDNSKADNRPIVTEINPSFKNLFGSIERVADQRGFWRTDFTRIKPGALHRANGGYLILDALDALTEPGVWQGLKRSLRSGKLEIQGYDPFYMFSQTALKPEPIDLKVQVIMIGMPEVYYLLFRLDPDFRKIFKVKADFDTVMDLNQSNLGKYNSFARRMVDDFDLLPFDKDGIGALVEYGVRLAGRNNKLSTRFNLIADIMREASYWAREANSSEVNGQHVDTAIAEWIRRMSLLED
ncbi:MAG: ATP-binding protein, partial [Candidatus Zixiibacteriota bacterium]